MPSTRWVDHLTPRDAEVDGRQQPVSVTADFDGDVGLDVTADVAAGAELSGIETHLWQLPTDLDTDYVAADTMLAGTPSATGDVIVQRVSGLARDRVYRLEAAFGPDGNRRGASLLIACAE